MPDIVTRQNVTQLSDGVVGDNFGPTAVQLRTFSAASQASDLRIAWLGGFSLLFALGGRYVWRRAQR